MLDPATLKCLVELGFVGAGHGAANQALELFEALRVLVPDGLFVHAGVASCFITLGRPVDAVRHLEQHAAEQLDADESLMAMYALALKQAGFEARAFAVLEKVRALGRDSAADALARRLLEVRNIMMVASSPERARA